MIFNKKNILNSKMMFLFLILFVFSCKTNDLKLRKINAKIVNINENQESNKEIDALIKPYAEDVNNKMNSVLCINPTAIEKKNINKFQNDIGNWMSDVVFSKTKSLFFIKYKKTLDICLLNSGGVRTILPAGNVTTRNAFEIMPFENEVVVLELSGEVIYEMAQFIVKEQKPHPMKGMIITLDKNDAIKSIKIGDEMLDNTKLYYVATNDYLAGGGDSMNFLKKNSQKFITDYKLRNLIIDYFKSVNEISFSKDERIIYGD
jgi:2',3'-cyclic-nucleotide 2'-phosphodiesterase (5'-nucleotidase family)